MDVLRSLIKQSIELFQKVCSSCHLHTKQSTDSLVMPSSDEVKKKILAALAEQLAVFEEGKIPLKELVLAVGYKHENTKAFVNALKELAVEGLVHKSSGCVVLTEKGRHLVPRDVKSKVVTNDDIQENYYSILEKKVDHKSKLREFWNILLDGRVHSGDAIVEKLGYTHKNSKGFTNPKAVMTKLKLIESVGQGFIRATDKVFPKGRPE
jgi:hypothetical protein